MAVLEDMVSRGALAQSRAWGDLNNACYVLSELDGMP
jgi:hypothetical protein